jgi:hypothetical protein
LQEETFNTFVVEDYEKIGSFVGQEFEEPELGQWQDLRTSNQSYWFGGSDCESDENENEGEGERLKGEKRGIGAIADNDEDGERLDQVDEDKQDDDDSGDFDEGGLDRDLLRKTHLGLGVAETEPSVIQITENLKLQLEENDLEQIIVQKPEFKKSVQTTSKFEKRSIKGKSFLRP